MSVQVINYMGGEAQVETRQTKRDDGSPGLDVIFKAAIDRRNSETLPGILGTGYATPKELRMR
jgi:hypothetical protein